MTDEGTIHNEDTSVKVSEHEQGAGKKKTKSSRSARTAETSFTQNKQVSRKIRKYSPEERAAIMAQVAKVTASGKISIKRALEKIGISEQTYYNWKKAEAPKAAAKTKSSPAIDLQELIALEEENQKLRKELAEKLRAENAELKKRLGLI